jgi:transcriptional regulator with XRE-family HTH domain
VTESFADRVRRLRRAKGWRQADLAERAGIGTSTVAHWEAETREPTAETLFLISDALGVDAGWLWRGRTTP